MGLFVIDECERLVKNQVSKMNQCSSRLACEKLTRRVTHEMAMCEAHDWKLKSHARLSSLRVFREKGHLAKHFVWQNDNLLYQILYPHYKYPHYSRIVSNAFRRENPSKYT